MTTATRPLDVICLGRAAVDLYGQQIGGRLEDMQSFAKYLGGSSANVAAGLARLGVRSAMLTRVGDEHMGRFVREQLAREGVDVGHVLTDPWRLTGLVVLGIVGDGAYPHIFFRRDCADMGVTVEDIDESWIASSRVLAVTGTHLSSETTRLAVLQAMRYARANGVRVLLDIDYRPVLWGLTAAGQGEERYRSGEPVTAALQQCLPLCDLVVGTEEEIHIAGGSERTGDALAAIRQATAAAIVMKRGSAGCVVYEEAAEPADGGRAVPGFPVEVLNVLGAGDAFLAGLLSGLLAGRPLAEAATIGNACGALVVSRHGCTPAMPSRVELDDYLARAATLRRPDLDDRLGHAHSATTTRAPRDELYVLAFDHRRQLEALAGETGVPASRIADFKSLVALAVERVAARNGQAERIGVIVDERHGAHALRRLSRAGYWVARPAEIPGSRPLCLDPRDDFGLSLLQWPANHVVKCLAFYHPDDPRDLRQRQEERLQSLHADCETLGRELLLELIVPSQGAAADDDATARALTRLYNLGVRPAWWKLQPQSEASWRAIESVIEQRDPWCNGVLLLGLDAPEEELTRSFAVAARVRLCRGFAVGRSIFGATARAWFAGELDDARAVGDMAECYQRLIGHWQAARRAAA
jgi:5-dehydro-2-deoxygluconokinase